MSVYIKGVEMPKNCCECFAFKSNASGQMFCKAKRIAFGKDDAEWLPKRTPNWCPLVPVPPHGRLIDADAFSDKILEIVERKKYNDFYAQSLSVGNILREVVREVNGTGLDGYANAPTIIPAEEGET